MHRYLYGWVHLCVESRSTPWLHCRCSLIQTLGLSRRVIMYFWIGYSVIGRTYIGSAFSVRIEWENSPIFSFAYKLTYLSSSKHRNGNWWGWKQQQRTTQQFFYFHWLLYLVFSSIICFDCALYLICQSLYLISDLFTGWLSWCYILDQTSYEFTDGYTLGLHAISRVHRHHIVSVSTTIKW